MAHVATLVTLVTLGKVDLEEQFNSEKISNEMHAWLCIHLRYIRSRSVSQRIA